MTFWALMKNKKESLDALLRKLIDTTKFSGLKAEVPTDGSNYNCACRVFQACNQTSNFHTQLQVQDRQFLLIGSIRNSRCFIEKNNTAYCLLIEENGLSCVPGNFSLTPNLPPVYFGLGNTYHP